MTPAPKCTGAPAPEWMDSIGSIHEAAQVYKEKLPVLMERTGGTVIGTAVGGINVCVEDRSTGIVFHWFQEPQKIGAIAIVPTTCQSTPDAFHEWHVHMRILRRAKISEVRKMAKRWGGPAPLVIREGLWYCVMTD